MKLRRQQGCEADARGARIDFGSFGRAAYTHSRWAALIQDADARIMDSDTFQVFTFLSRLAVDRIGGLPRDAIVGLVAPGTQYDPLAFTPETFKVNPAFVRFLHDVIGGCAHEIAGIQAEAQRIGDGYVYLFDGRTPTPQGDVPPEDILGFVVAEAGRAVPGSYQANENHRIVTARGLFRLDADLHEHLLNAMRLLPPT